MHIEPHAFYNCTSLHTVDFTACDEVSKTGIYQDNIELSQINVIVKDKFYEQQKKVESPFIKVIRQSDSILEKLKLNTKTVIVASICKLETVNDIIHNTDIKNAITAIIEFLRTKYNINEEILKSLKKIKI